MAVMTPEKIEQELLELAMLEDNLKCGDCLQIGCTNDAELALLCPCKQGKALLCTECFELVQRFTSSHLFGLIRPRKIFFGGSCLHVVRFKDCAVVPI